MLVPQLAEVATRPTLEPVMKVVLQVKVQSLPKLLMMMVVLVFLLIEDLLPIVMEPVTLS